MKLDIGTKIITGVLFVSLLSGLGCVYDKEQEKVITCKLDKEKQRVVSIYDENDILINQIHDAKYLSFFVEEKNNEKTKSKAMVLDKDRNLLDIGYVDDSMIKNVLFLYTTTSGNIVSSENINIPEEDFKEYQTLYTVSSEDGVYLRSEPSENDKKNTFLSKGSTVYGKNEVKTNKESEFGWTEVIYFDANGEIKHGYVASDYLFDNSFKKFQGKIYKVKTSGDSKLKLRENHNINSDIILEMDDNTIIYQPNNSTIYEDDYYKWYYVAYRKNNRTYFGWCAAEEKINNNSLHRNMNVEPKNMNNTIETFYTVNDTLVYGRPYLSEPINQIDKETYVKASETINNNGEIWYRIFFDDDTIGYTQAGNLRKVSIIDVTDNQDVYDPKIKF